MRSTDGTSRGYELRIDLARAATVVAGSSHGRVECPNGGVFNFYPSRHTQPASQ
jgi:hypothetical protein